MNALAEGGKIVSGMAQTFFRNKNQVDEPNWLESDWKQPLKRLFWINQVPEFGYRGGHRHPSCQMMLQCVIGSVHVYVQTPFEDHFYYLSTPHHYLLLAPQDWRFMYRFSPDAILLVMAEEPFDRTHYIDEPYRPVNLNRLVPISRSEAK
ncbi:sugar 3,4-ketoisomerase [Spirosoma endbachense]|uniref:Sugar 3,4-ketoisomerase QdtA cupin domain-containing protein n=1 Tax=Spirosoma endbachense TaxID=2666025 RepID=A0A6P1W0N3_9BACT|nr:FdtA/QdtA family cupin domain-containing protein [Spirosoma endbachense]QHV98148.1 hypothetical protein GJR95_25475 [Spirosoma endbachense]